jgi:hypothetical protein
MTPWVRRASAAAFLLVALPCAAETRRDALLNQTGSQPPVELKSEILKLTDRGLEPANVTLSSGEAILFLLNTSTDALATVEVTYGNRATHCATPNMKIEPDGVVHSSRPLGPKDFASVCFHDPGQYPITVYGLPSEPDGLQAIVTVEP